MQTTLARTTRCTGVGLHSGVKARMVLRPAPSGVGVVVRRTDMTGPDGVIRVTPEAVVDTKLCTMVGNDAGARVATVEHVFAALSAAGVDNVYIDIDGPEIPALDGSAAPFGALIRQAGLQRLAARRRVLRVLKPWTLRVGDRVARFEPCDRFEVDVTIDFDRGGIGRQHMAAVVESSVFAAEIADARTFAFADEVAALREAGLALGGSLENCVVLDGDGVMNADGLRYQDEFVRHKTLDVIGDLYAAGAPIQGRYVVDRPGHALNNDALRGLLADEGAYEWGWATPALRPTVGLDAGAELAVA